MQWNSLISYFSRYFLSGVLTTLVHFATLILLVKLAAMEPIKASVAGFCLAAIYNYIFQYYWAFKVATGHRQFLSRFLSIHIITLVVNDALFWLISAQLSYPFWMVQLYVSACIIAFNIPVNGHFIYNSIKSCDSYDSSKKPLVSRKFITTFVRYFISGGLATLIHFGTLVLLIEQFAVYPVAATTAGFCLAVVFNYTAQYYWTFKVKGPHQQFMLRFIVVTTFTLLLNTGLFWLMYDQLLIPYLFSQLVATGTVFLLNFFINHFYTFNNRSTNQDATDLA